jgi:hypothetical protein
MAGFLINHKDKFHLTFIFNVNTTISEDVAN